MVYCGPPSKGCYECRSRRTKCDTNRPFCSQCIRAGRKCTGYRDPTDVMFRNQTDHFKKKFRQAKTNFAKPRNSRYDPRPIDIDSQCTSIDVPNFSRQSITFRIGPSLEEQATCFFFQNYVLEEQRGPRGHFSYLTDVYGKELVNNALDGTLISLGMAGLANVWKAPEILIRARIKYTSALHSISQRLRNIDEAKDDQTLISVVLLGLWEMNTSDTPSSIIAWTRHITGAATILFLRGKQQLRTPIGHNLFTQIRSHVIMNCLQQHVAVPQKLVEWSKYALKFETVEQAATTALCQIWFRFCALRASMSSFSDYSNALHVVSSATDIDNEFVNWAKNCPLLYVYETVSLEERSEDVFSDHYHVYDSVWIATVWNNYRSARILVNELLLGQLTHLRYHQYDDLALASRDPGLYESRMLAAKSIIFQANQDICASVPFFLGMPNTTSSTAHLPRMVGGNLILWPLYAALCSAVVSDMMRSWVVGRMRKIADVMGIRQAAPVAHVVSMGEEVSLGEIEDGNTLMDESSTDSVEDSAESWSDPILYAHLQSSDNNRVDISPHAPMYAMPDNVAQDLSDLSLDFLTYAPFDGGLNTGFNGEPPGY